MYAVIFMSTYVQATKSETNWSEQDKWLLIEPNDLLQRPKTLLDQHVQSMK